MKRKRKWARPMTITEKLLMRLATKRKAEKEQKEIVDTLIARSNKTAQMLLTVNENVLGFVTTEVRHIQGVISLEAHGGYELVWRNKT